MIIFFSLKPRNRFSLMKAFRWLAVDLQILLSYCKLKLSLTSIWIPSNSIDDTTYIFWLLITIHWFIWSLFLLSNKMAGNLSALTIILLFLNQSMTISDPDCKMSINSKIVSSKADTLWVNGKSAKKSRWKLLVSKNIWHLHKILVTFYRLNLRK